MSRSLLKRLRTMAPDVEWMTPIPTTVYGSDAPMGFLCRICVADKGYKPKEDLARLFSTEEACLEHIGEEHVAR